MSYCSVFSRFLIRTRYGLPAVAALLLLLASPESPGSATEPAEVKAPSHSPAQASERIQHLRTEISRHDRLYWEEHAPVISDYAYDQLKRELRTLETAFPEIASSPDPAPAGLEAVATELPSSAHRHRAPMLSLEKAYTRSEWERFHRRVIAATDGKPPRYRLEPKYDGLAVSLTFVHGKLVAATTRGDGRTGETITANLLALTALPSRLAPASDEGKPNPIPDLIELRGEIFLPLEAFAALNAARSAAGEPVFTSPRNLAAGAVRLSDPQAGAADLTLAAVFFGVGACEPSNLLPASESGLRDTIAAWGLPVVADVRSATGSDEAWKTLQALAAERTDWDFPSDGIVVKLANRSEQRILGESATAPHWALAYKFAPPQATSRLRRIEVQVGRTGLLTPVAVFDPVQLGGATLRRASLHHFEAIKALDLHLGDTVVVERVGDVIPQIAQVDDARRKPDAKPFRVPFSCPECDTPVEQDQVHTRCPNWACPAQRQRRLEHFAGRPAVDIDGLGPVTAEKLVRHLLALEVNDLFHLSQADLPALRSVGIPAPERLLAAIQDRRNAPFWRFLTGLGIPGVGPATAKKLADAAPSWNALLAATPAQLGTVPGIGEKTAQTIAAHLRKPEVITLIRALETAKVGPVARSEM